MNSNKIRKNAWLWLLPVLALLAAAAVFGYFVFQNITAKEPASTPAPAPTPTPVPALRFEAGYFPAEQLLFRPEDPFTRGQAADIFSALTGKEETFGPAEDEALTETALPLFLRHYFDEDAVNEAMTAIRGRGDAVITRAEAVVCLNRLSGIAPTEAGGYYPDVAPEHWAYGHILAAAGGSGHREPLTQGFVNLEGWLYCADSRGYFRTNSYIDALYFDGNGRYTCGNEELDAHVARVIAENTVAGMDREDMLRAMYEYVRDNFTYMRRNYYRSGDAGWQIREALTMYSTGKGNCYCYASAFWAAARGLGYNAKIVSGTVGAEESPHGWVEIVMGGVRYTYDVELEMARHRDGYPNTDLYKMTNAMRRGWNYVGADYSDDKFHRETEASLLPG